MTALSLTEVEVGTEEDMMGKYEIDEDGRS